MSWVSVQLGSLTTSKRRLKLAKVGYGIGTVGIVRNLAVSSPPDAVGAFLSGAGMVPGYVGMGASVVSLGWDLHKGFHHDP